jgi:hypothetical protein
MFNFVPYDSAREDDLSIPECFRVTLGAREYWIPSFRHGVNAISREINTRTLLFMPNLDGPAFLRLMAATEPPLLIGNDLGSLYKWKHLYELASPEDREVCAEQWEAETRAFNKLRDNYFRRGTASGFMAYDRINSGGWLKGQQTAEVFRLREELGREIPTHYDQVIHGSLDEYLDWLEERAAERE